MSNYMAYHNADQRGPYPCHTGNFGHYSGFSSARLRAIVGSRVWVVSGSTPPSQKRKSFALVSVFSPTEVRPDGDIFCVWSAQGSLFKPPISLDHLPWFAELKTSQNNFSYGLSRIREPHIVDALDQLLATSPVA